MASNTVEPPQTVGSSNATKMKPGEQPAQDSQETPQAVSSPDSKGKQQVGNVAVQNRPSSPLGKIRAQSTDPNSLDHYWHAGVYYNDDLSYGIAAKFSRFRPKIEDGDHSLIQCLASNKDPSHPKQTIEAGWRIAAQNTNEPYREPYIFIFYTVSDYKPEGRGLGGYVENFDDPVGASDADSTGDFKWIVANPQRRQLFYGLPNSHIDGTQLDTKIMWKLQKGVPGIQDGWYLALDDVFVGYLPAHLFTDLPKDSSGNTIINPATKKAWDPFSANTTLADHAGVVKVYGEVYDADYNRSQNPPNIPTSSDMGSGKFPDEGFYKSAYISTIQRRADMGEKWVNADLDSWAYQKLESDNRPLNDTQYDIKMYPTKQSLLSAFCYVGGSGYPQPSGSWTDWDRISPLDMRLGSPPNVHITALTRPGVYRTELLIVSQTGIVYHCYWSDDDWSGINSQSEWRAVNWGQSTPLFNTETEIVAISRRSDSFDIFGVAQDGHVYTAFYADVLGWTGWWDISKKDKFPTNAPLAAVSRSSTAMDLFLNNNGTIVTSTWDDSNQRWSGGDNQESNDDNTGGGGDSSNAGSSDTSTATSWFTIDTSDMNNGSTIAATAPLLALARDADTMEVFVSASDGVYGASYVTDPSGPTVGWGGFEAIGTTPTPHFTSATRLAGVSRSADKLDLVALDTAGNLYWAAFDNSKGGWIVSPNQNDNGDVWQLVGGPPTDVPFSEQGYIAALMRPTLTDIDLFVGADNGQVYRTHYSDNGSRWAVGADLAGLLWDADIGGNLSARADKLSPAGYSFAVTSRQTWSLSVLMVMPNATIYGSEYQGN
jgi:hypothetical protein